MIGMMIALWAPSLVTSAVLDKRQILGQSFSTDFPDPSLINADGTWWAYSSSSGPRNVPVASGGFSHFNFVGDALPNPGPWAQQGGIYGVDVNRMDGYGDFFMYYSAYQNGGGPHCIGVARSSTPQGPFQPQNAPLYCDGHGTGVIDPAGFDDGAQRWLMWKVDGNSLGGSSTCNPFHQSGGYYGTPIQIVKVTRDGLHITSSPTTIIDNNGAGDDGVLEAPSMVATNGGFILFFSTHCYNSDNYAVNYAFGARPDSIFARRGTVITSNINGQNIWGPGGLDIDPNGQNAVQVLLSEHGQTCS